jgi:hypothetical protein
LRWHLHELEIKCFLSPIHRIVFLARGLFVESNIHEWEVDDAKRNCLDFLLDKLIDSLWDKFLTVFEEGNVSATCTWMKAIREISLYVNASPRSFEEWFDDSPALCYKYLIMTTVFKLKAVDLEASSLMLAYDEDSNIKITCKLLSTILTENDCLGDILKLIAVATASFSNDQLQAILVEVLLTMLEKEIFLEQSDYRFVLLAGLFGAPASVIGGTHCPVDAKRILSSVFSILTNTSRTELLKKILMQRSVAMLDSLNEMIGRIVDRHGRTAYLPSIARAALPEILIEKLRQKIPTMQPTDPQLWHWHHDDCERIIFQAARLHLLSSGTLNINQSIHRFMEYHNAAPNLRPIDHIYRMVIGMQVLCMGAEQLSKVDHHQQQYRRICAGLKDVIAIAPQTLAIFFLSRLPDPLALTKILQDRDLLTIIGILWWFSPEQRRLSDADHLSPADMEAYQQQYDANHVKHVCAFLAKALVDEAMLQQQWNLPSLEQLIRIPVDRTDSALINDCSNVIKLLLETEHASALLMNSYIPTLIEVYRFFWEKFSYKFKSNEEARSMKVEEVLALLPIKDRREGYRLFKLFLECWTKLRQFFDTFVLCPRENRAAAMIPALTNAQGSNPTYLYHLVELSDSETAESMPVRMLGQRLIDFTDKILVNHSLVNIRKSIEINPHQHLADEDYAEAHPSHLQRCNGVSQCHPLLTGPLASTRLQQMIEDFVVCHAGWVSTSTAWNLDTMFEEPRTIDLAAAVQQSRDRQAREGQLAAHNANLILCPGCGTLNERVSGCEHLTCGNPENPYGRVATLRLGCGMALNAINNRVPAPTPDAPLLPRFQAQVVQLPAGLLNAALPQLPAIPEPTGYYQVNLIALTRYLLSRLIHGRVKIHLDKEFFAPMPLKLKFNRNHEDQRSLDLAVNHSARAAIHVHKRNLDEYVPPSSMADVYIRLLLVADQLEECYEEHGVTMDKFAEDGLKRIANRLDEKHLRENAENLLEVCVTSLCRCLSLIESLNPVSDGLRRCSEKCSVLMSESNALNAWDASVKKEVSSLMIMHCAQISRVFAAVGIKGSNYIKQSALSVEIGRRDLQDLHQVMDELLQQYDKDKWADILADLERFGALLAKEETKLLKLRENMAIKEVPFLKPMLSSSAVLSRIINRLRIHHYSELMRFIRQFIGQITYKKLSVEYVHRPTMVIDTTTNEETLKPDEIALAFKRSSDVYQELVSEEWIHEQEIEIGRDGEFIYTAAALLRKQNQILETSFDLQPSSSASAIPVDDLEASMEHEDASSLMVDSTAKAEEPMKLPASTLSLGRQQALDRLCDQDVDRASTTMTGSDTLIEDESKLHNHEEDTVLATPPPAETPSQRDDGSGTDSSTESRLDCKFIWTILTRFKNPQLELQMEELGLDEAAGLEFCQKEEIESMATTLPILAKRKVLAAIGCCQPSLKVLAPQTVWEMLSKSVAVMDSLRELGLSLEKEADALDLQYLSMEEVEQWVLSHFKPVPRRKLLSCLERLDNNSL